MGLFPVAHGANMQHRAIELLHDAGRRYPGAWQAHDEFRADRANLGGWPEWCYCPMAGAYAVVSGGGNSTVPLDRMSDVALVAAAAAWRPTQGIYRFAPELLDALLETPVTGDLPTDALHRLPEWCVYVVLEREIQHWGYLHGFLAHLEYDANDRHEELRILLDGDTPLPVPLHLGGDLQAAIADAAITAQINAAKRGMPADVSGKFVEALSPVEPLVSVLLYLCAEQPEIEGDGQPHRPKPVRRKIKGTQAELITPAAKRPLVWTVGRRIGEALRHATGTGDSPAGHIRRAHWHSYWTGPKGRQRRIVKWLPPIPVNLDGGDVEPREIHVEE